MTKYGLKIVSGPPNWSCPEEFKKKKDAMSRARAILKELRLKLWKGKWLNAKVKVRKITRTGGTTYNGKKSHYSEHSETEAMVE